MEKRSAFQTGGRKRLSQLHRERKREREREHRYKITKSIWSQYAKSRIRTSYVQNVTFAAASKQLKPS